MTATLIGLSIAITVVACLIRFAVWIFWPRVIEHDTDAHEMIPPGWEKEL